LLPTEKNCSVFKASQNNSKAQKRGYQFIAFQSGTSRLNPIVYYSWVPIPTCVNSESSYSESWIPWGLVMD